MGCKCTRSLTGPPTYPKAPCVERFRCDGKTLRGSLPHVTRYSPLLLSRVARKCKQRLELDQKSSDPVFPPTSAELLFSIHPTLALLSCSTLLSCRGLCRTACPVYSWRNNKDAEHVQVTAFQPFYRLSLWKLGGTPEDNLVEILGESD